METTTKYAITVREVWDDEVDLNKVSITIELSNPDNTHDDYKPATLIFHDDGLHGQYFEEYINGLTFDFWMQKNLYTDLTKNDEVGECDLCGDRYELASRDGRCGDCGNCADCCEDVE